MSGLNVDVPVGEALPPSAIDAVSNHIGRENKPKQFSTFVTVFDYDDTILPSSWLSKLLSNTSILEENMVSELKKVERSAYNLLVQARRVSQVVIITNAEENWVQDSARVFLPMVYSILDSVKIVSARSRFQMFYPCNSALWKELTFRSELDKICTDCEAASILSIGDSLLEREATFAYGRSNSYCVPKSIKMIDAPTPAQLSTQQELIGNSFLSMTLSREKLDLKLSVQTPFN